MKFVGTIIYLLLIATMAPVQSQPSAEGSKSSDVVRRFDGTWAVTLTCADFKDDKSGAKGYTYRFLMSVKDGVLLAEHQRENEPGWVRYDGRIDADGTAMITAKGLTGDPKTAVGQISKGTPYSYRVKAEFNESRGHGTRLDLRPCEVVFVKQ